MNHEPAQGHCKDKTEPCTHTQPGFAVAAQSGPALAGNLSAEQDRALPVPGIFHVGVSPQGAYMLHGRYSLVFSWPGTLGLDNLAHSSLPSGGISKGYGGGTGVSCMCWMAATDLQPKDTFCSTNLFPLFPH